jgi:hypothetical protein
MIKLVAGLVLCAALLGCADAYGPGQPSGGAAGVGTGDISTPQQQPPYSPYDNGVHGGGGGY